MSALLLILATQGVFGVDLPGHLVSTHEQTQVGHGLITGAGAGVGALIDGERGAKVGALLIVGYYLVRETLAHRFYARADLTPQERSKARWDSKMDVAYPVAVASIPWTWGHRGEAWPWWVAGLAATYLIGRATDPGGMYSGMR